MNLNKLRCPLAIIALAGIMTNEAQGVITLTWVENAGDGNDVQVTLSGSYVVQNIEAQDNSYSIVAFSPGRFVDPSFPENYDWERGGVPTVGFLSDVTSIAQSTIGLNNDFFMQTESGLAIPVSLSVGDSYAPTGTVIFEDSTFESLFGVGVSPSEFVSYEAPDGSDGVISVAGSGTVPEPSASLLVALAGLGLLNRRRR